MTDGSETGLVCFDRSSDAAAAVRVAARLFSQLHAQVVHVWRSPAPEGTSLQLPAPKWPDGGVMVDAAVEVLDTVASGAAETRGG